MGSVGVVAAALVACIFAWSAIAKVRDRGVVGRDFAKMGIPFASVALVLVVIAEFVTAALLLVRPRLGAAAAVVLLAGFSAVLAAVIRSGRDISCGCFGANQSEPISPVDLVRNGALAALAALALFADRAAGIDLPAVMVATLSALCLLVVVQLAGLARASHGGGFVSALLTIELAGESRAEEVAENMGGVS